MHGTRPIDALRRFWWIVVIFTIGGILFAGLPQPEQAADSVTRWNASHTMLVSSSSGSGFTDGQAFSQLTLFATVGEVPARVAERLGFGGPPAALAAQVTVSSDQQTGALRIITTQTTADEAVEIADTFAAELSTYLAERQDQLVATRQAASLARLQELEAQIDEVEPTVLIPASDEDGQPVEDPIARAQLDALSRQYSVAFEQNNNLQTDQGGLVLTTLEAAQPVAITERGLSAPRSRAGRAVLGGIVGAAIGFGIALLLVRADRRIRTPEQAAEIVGIEAHTTIPAVRGHKTDLLAVVHGRHGPLPDSYRRLRSLIAFLDSGDDALVDRGSITVVVSPGAGDGKTSLTANLAAAMVESGKHAVAVNADFRRPTLSERLDVFDPAPVGLSLDDIEHADLEFVLAPGPDPGMAVLDLAGLRGHPPGDLARVTARMLPRIANAAGGVVIDTSPISATAEALEFLPIADNVVMVVRLGHTTSAAARRTVEMVRTLSTGNLLLVLVGGDSGNVGKYYYYTDPEPLERGRFGRRKPKETPVNA